MGYSKVGRIDIGNDVFIGAKSVILPNVKIGNKVIIGAGAVVARDIPDNSVVIGNPCQIVCTYDDYMEKHKKAMKTKPVYNTYVSQKSDEDKVKMKEELKNTIGYDM